jgi:hypothetical protein
LRFDLKLRPVYYRQMRWIDHDWFRIWVACVLLMPACCVAQTVKTFSGGDPGEGLDFEGDFIYAIDVAGRGGVKIGDAQFVPDQGATDVEVGAIQSSRGYYSRDFGRSENDRNLGWVMRDVSWSPDPDRVTLRLGGLRPTVSYKLQLLFGDRPVGRGFDVRLNGKVVLRAMRVSKSVGGPLEAPLVLTHSFVATGGTATVSLGGGSGAFSDRNPMLNAFTLEVDDADGDGLGDQWEHEHFSNLKQSAAGDSDGDGLTNKEEMLHHTSPNKSDTDGDGLSDPDEIGTHKTDPLKKDTDSDGLTDFQEVRDYPSDPNILDTDGDELADGEEVLKTGTAPEKRDTDGDGFSDYLEVVSGTDPLDPKATPKAANPPLISEFMAENRASLQDEDGDYSDWIEVRDDGDVAIDLDGYYLTDDAKELKKWKFPPRVLKPSESFVLFASGKNRRASAPVAVWHTNFKLGAKGEYLALVDRDGKTVVSEFGKKYPPQFPDRSYGIGESARRKELALVGPAAPCRWLVPSKDLGNQWASIKFKDDAWAKATTGIGYELRTGYEAAFGRGGTVTQAMFDRNPSIYVRIPFEVADSSGQIVHLKLRIQYDDGFVAHLNGHRVAAENAPVSPKWNSLSTDGHPDTQALKFTDIDLSGAIEHLKSGDNVLAIHGLNDEIDSSDLLIVPELHATYYLLDAKASGELGYLDGPTPGEVNMASFKGFTEPPAFSVQRGFYDEAFELQLEGPADSEIRFTTDGSLPTSDYGVIYGNPIDVTKTTVVRASAFRKGYRPGGVATHTYFFVKDVITQPVMSKQITEHRVYGKLMEKGLKAQPSISIVAPEGIDFDEENAISIEMIDPSGAEKGFQIDGGARRVGGTSVRHPKNHFRIYFRSRYGIGKLKYPMFADHPYSKKKATEFDQLTLRSGSHDTPFWLGDDGIRNGRLVGNAQYVRNRWMSDIQFLMGHVSLHGRWAQVYLNGVYHGHYQIMERPTRSFLATYFGGKKETYDSLNSQRPTGDSETTTWQKILSLTDDYAAFSQYVDVENYIDYSLLNFYAGNDWDWRPSQNWMGGGSRIPGKAGYTFYSWDADITLQSVNANCLYKGLYTVFFEKLLKHEAFRFLLVDRVRAHFYDDGCLTPERAKATYNYRAEQIRTSIIPETARWKPGTWFRDVEWQRELDRLNHSFFPARTNVVVKQLQKVGWFPMTPPPTITPGTGTVAQKTRVILRSNSGEIHYTLDGTDPRTSRRSTRGGCRITLTVNDNLHIKACVRSQNNAEWSPLVEAVFQAKKP